MANEPPLILLVDDDLDFLEINRAILEGAGYRVATAHDPKEALERMAAEAPALVISDLMMQALDAGFSFSRQVKEDPRFASIPVLMVTSAASRHGLDFHPRSAEDLAAMHADGFLDKPVRPKVLLAKVSDLLIHK